MVGVKRKDNLNQKANKNLYAPSDFTAKFIACPPSTEYCFKCYDEGVQKVRIVVLQKAEEIINMIKNNTLYPFKNLI